jgi:pantoate--beta-alanine ligase
MDVCPDIVSIRAFVSAARGSGNPVVLVPTMGALHDGHRACVEAGRAVDGGRLVVSIFVNPTQFGAGEDLDQYPRPLERDLELCRAWGCAAVFTPSAAEMYPAPQRTWVTVEELSVPLCGRSRPGHFRGVTTVVAKLFHIVGPDEAVFGQKDAQQALVIREMVRQLDMPVELRLAPIERDPDGLALSSRNAYLDASQRRRAAGIYRSLCGAREKIRGGERDPNAVVTAVAEELARGGIDDVEYAELLAADDLSPLGHVEGKVILAVAARVGTTRLIDNMVLNVTAAGATEEPVLF